ncbi:35768_t:CDS:2 [Gigaspora margarita]|uniref:35768_t:CDS:1 n=1 Tax=Gigaspora margarita TaxID=4874 RepID=A0ABN7UFD6_GIGMA|nr:35768_t:CDS:2 [Gigaspora margarita]
MSHLNGLNRTEEEHNETQPLAFLSFQNNLIQKASNHNIVISISFISCYLYTAHPLFNLSKNIWTIWALLISFIPPTEITNVYKRGPFPDRCERYWKTYASF